MATRSDTTRIIVPCKFAYVNCWKPISQYNGSVKYSVVIVINKNDEKSIAKVREGIDYVIEHSTGVWGGIVPENLKLPLHDGDKEKPNNQFFENCMYLNAKSKQPPQIVDSMVEPITNPSEFYSGCYGKVSIRLYAYNVGGSKGIAAWLGNIQKLADGEAFTGRITAKEEFSVETGGGVYD